MAPADGGETRTREQDPASRLEEVEEEIERVRAMQAALQIPKAGAPPTEEEVRPLLFLPVPPSVAHGLLRLIGFVAESTSSAGVPCSSGPAPVCGRVCGPLLQENSSADALNEGAYDGN